MLSVVIFCRKDVGYFLRVAQEDMFHFDGSYRPVPLQQVLVGIQERCPRAQHSEMLNSVCYDFVVSELETEGQVLIFVHSRGDTRATAETILDIATKRHHLKALFDIKSTEQYAAYEPEMRRSKDKTLRRLFPFGIGVHHAGMLPADRRLSEELFSKGKLRAIQFTCC